MSISHREPFEEAFDRLVRDLSSESADESTALFLLELNSSPVFPANDDRFYEARLPPGLLERPLTAHEELLLVNEMHRLVLASIQGERRMPGGSGLIFAMGAANSWVGASPALDIFVRHTDELALAELHQAVHALIKLCSREGPQDLHYREVVLSLQACDPTETIRRLVGAGIQTDQASECLPLDLRELSEIVLDRLT